MSREQADASLYSKAKLSIAKATTPSLDIIFTPRGNFPLCNQSCNGCYYFANYETDETAISANDVPGLIEGLKEDGYRNFFLITSEILLADSWEELLKASGDRYVNTNGRIIAADGDTILERLSRAGVQRLIITANLTNSHKELKLAPKEIVDAAFQNINDYNTKNPANAFKTEATIIVTSENYDKVEKMCSYVHDEYKVASVKLLAFLALPNQRALTRLMPSKSQLAIIVEQITRLRERFAADVLYVHRGGTLGSQGLSPDKKANLCPAGTGIYSVKSFEEGAMVMPCFYAPQIAIGTIRDGKIVIDQAKLNEFLNVKNQALDEGLCPAYAANSPTKT